MKMTSASNNKPKICFVIPSLNGGGAEKVLINLANQFGKLVCKPVIISLNKSLPAYSINKELKVYHLLDRKSDLILYRLYYIIQTFFKLLFIILKEKPVCVISFITSANLWTGVTCNIANTPYIVSERTSPDRSINQLNNFSRNLAALIYKRAAAVVVSARGIGGCLKENKAFKKLNNIHLIENAVSQFDRLSLNKVHSRKFILGVGRLAYVKGFDQLISAYGSAKLDNTDLLIIGEGEERATLLSQVENLGLGSRVFMPGTKTNLQDYYNQAELFVLPSRNEGYPNALIEAMSFGCPCVAMDCDFGPAEIIKHEHNGLLVEAGNITAFADAIIRLDNNTELKSKLGNNAKRIKQTNNAKSILKKWAQLVLAPDQIVTELT
ncbi:glycosyltransferase [Mucilaginibacter sp.]|uniref:glycosyltransferase n=1 Tax=Mucilaginibacter sp. TaxID=1882438 RepID=UPI00261BD47A|nr:glycosyltransferase [Mucilaginibacter sp.]